MTWTVPSDHGVRRQVEALEAEREAQEQENVIHYYAWSDKKGPWLIYSVGYEWMREDMAPAGYLDDAGPGLILECGPEQPELPHTLRYPPEPPKPHG